jgi:hypothetical protein
MQPRGQLWFELQRVCQDFRAYSGLTQREALEVLVAVLGNLLGEQEDDLKKLISRGGPEGEGPRDGGAASSAP